MPWRRLIPVLVIELLDATAFSMVIVLLAYAAREQFGASGLIVGLLLSFKQIILMAAAPLMGRLSDRFGRRPLLLVSFFGTLISYVTLAFSGTIWMLFVSRFFDGVSGGNYSLIQSCVCDISDRRHRAKALGLSGAAFGMGFIIGPVLGFAATRSLAPTQWIAPYLGINATTPFAFGFLVASGISLLTLVYTFLGIRESRRCSAGEVCAPDPESTVPSRRAITSFLSFAFAFYFPLFVFDSMLAVYLQTRFHLAVAESFRLVAIVGVCQIVSQAGFAGWMIGRLGETRMLIQQFILLGIGLIGVSLDAGQGVLMVSLVITGTTAGLINTVIRSALSRAAGPSSFGGVMGWNSSVSGFARLLAPIAGGMLLDLSASLPFLVSGLCCFLAGTLAIMHLTQERPYHETAAQSLHPH